MVKFSREEEEKLAQAISEVDADSSDGFFQRLAARLRLSAQQQPAVVIDFDGLKVVTDATNAAASLPSLPNVCKAIGKVQINLPQHTSACASKLVKSHAFSMLRKAL